jgi:diaminopimelate epimerase
MLLRFTKMHGLGNDFMVLDLVSQHAHILPKHAKLWGDRHTGVGFDQLLLVEAPSNPEVDFRYRIFNSDGSEVEQCGNGARCFARFVLDKRLTAKRQIRVETKSGIIELDIRSDGQIGVNMGAPRLVPADIPFQATEQALSYPVDVDGKTVNLAAVSMGNPHAVLRVDDINNAPVHELGPKIENHPRFPVARVGTRGRRNPGLRYRRLRRCRSRDQPGVDGFAAADRPARWTPVHRMGRPRPTGENDRPGHPRLRRTGPSMSEQI